MKGMKYTTALILVIVFALTLLPGVALAAEAEPDVVLEESLENETLPEEAEDVEPIAELAEMDATGEDLDWVLVEPEQLEEEPQAYLQMDEPGAETQALAAPKNLKAAKGSSYIRLSWSAVGGAYRYLIGRATTREPARIPIIGNTTSTTYTDKTTTKYYYFVAAQDSAGVQGKIAGPVFGGQLPAPKNCKARSISYNQIKVTWDKVSSASGYAIYRKTSTAAKWGNPYKVVSASTTSLVDKSVTLGKTYYYSINAVQGSDLGLDGATVKAKVKLGKPGNFAARAITGRKVRLSWSKVSGASGYIVYRSKSKTSGFNSIKLASASTTAFTDSKLTAGNTYYYKVVPYRTVSGKKVKGTATDVVGAKAIK